MPRDKDGNKVGAAIALGRARVMAALCLCLALLPIPPASPHVVLRPWDYAKHGGKPPRVVLLYGMQSSASTAVAAVMAQAGPSKLGGSEDPCVMLDVNAGYQAGRREWWYPNGTKTLKGRMKCGCTQQRRETECADDAKRQCTAADYWDTNIPALDDPEGAPMVVKHVSCSTGDSQMFDGVVRRVNPDVVIIVVREPSANMRSLDRHRYRNSCGGLPYKLRRIDEAVNAAAKHAQLDGVTGTIYGPGVDTHPLPPAEMPYLGDLPPLLVNGTEDNGYGTRQRDCRDRPNCGGVLLDDSVTPEVARRVNAMIVSERLADSAATLKAFGAVGWANDSQKMFAFLRDKTHFAEVNQEKCNMTRENGHYNLHGEYKQQSADDMRQRASLPLLGGSARPDEPSVIGGGIKRTKKLVWYGSYVPSNLAPTITALYRTLNATYAWDPAKRGVDLVPLAEGMVGYQYTEKQLRVQERHTRRKAAAAEAAEAAEDHQEGDLEALQRGHELRNERLRARLELAQEELERLKAALEAQNGT